MAMQYQELSPLREVVAVHPVIDYLMQHEGSRLLKVTRQAYYNFDVCAVRLYIKCMENRKDELQAEINEKVQLHNDLAVQVTNYNNRIGGAPRLEAQEMLRQRKYLMDSMHFLDVRKAYILKEIQKIEHDVETKYEYLAVAAAEEEA